MKNTMQNSTSSFRNTPLGVFLNLFALVILMIFGNGSNANLFAQPPATVDVLGVPEAINTQVGSNFSVMVRIDPDGGSVTVADIRMSFNPEMIQVQSVALAAGTPLSFQNQAPTIDNENGFIQYGGFGFTPATAAFDHILIQFTAVGSGSSFLEHVLVGQPITIMALAGFNVTDETPAIPINITIDQADCPELGVNNGDPCQVGGANGAYVDCQCVPFDCDGVPDGSASIDECGVCSGGTTGLEPNITCLDCLGNPNGPAVEGAGCQIDGTEGMWNANCECIPTITYDCPELEANFGDPCDDGNQMTENDVINGDCGCDGTPITGDLHISVGEYLECEDPLARVLMYLPGTTTLVHSYENLTISGGEITLAGIPAGEYDVFVKVAYKLQQGFDEVNISPSLAEIALEPLVHGDFDESNGINGADFSILSEAFNSVEGGATFDQRADLNCDGGINGLDFSLFSENYNITGSAPPLLP